MQATCVCNATRSDSRTRTEDLASVHTVYGHEFANAPHARTSLTSFRGDASDCYPRRASAARQYNKSATSLPKCCAPDDSSRIYRCDRFKAGAE